MIAKCRGCGKERDCASMPHCGVRLCDTCAKDPECGECRKCKPRPKIWIGGLPSKPDDTAPSWDNMVRMIEEART